MKQNVNIVCVCVGDKYNKQHVNRLYRMVKKNCSLPFSFYCISDVQQDVNTIFIDKSLDLELYWWKVCLFNLDWSVPTLYLDLDIVVQNNIDDIISAIDDNIHVIKIEDYTVEYPYDGRYTIMDIPEGVINTSIMGLIPNKHKDLFTLFMQNCEYNMIKYYGFDRFVYYNSNKFKFFKYGDDYYHRTKGFNGDNYDSYPNSKICVLSQAKDIHYKDLEKYFL